MPQRIRDVEAGPEVPGLPPGVVLKPPVTIEELKTDTEHDPAGAEEFVNLVRRLRGQDLRSTIR